MEGGLLQTSVLKNTCLVYRQRKGLNQSKCIFVYYKSWVVGGCQGCRCHIELKWLHVQLLKGSAYVKSLKTMLQYISKVVIFRFVKILECMRMEITQCTYTVHYI